MQNQGGDSSSIFPGYPACRFLIFATAACFLLQIFTTREPAQADFDKQYNNAFEHYFAELQSDPELSLSEEEQRDLAAQRAASIFGNMPQVSVVQKWLELDTDKVLHGQVWRLVTTAFLHDRFGIWHILINMALLFWFGRALEDMYGHREFLAMYLTAAVVASIVYVGLELMIGERIPAIGASGAVMAVVCLYAIYHPSDTINLMFFLPVQMRYLVWIYVIYDLHPVLLSLSGTPVHTGTAHAAHLGGLLFGYLYYRFGWTLEPAVTKVMSLFQSRQTKDNSNEFPQRTNQVRSNRSAAQSSAPRVQRLEKSLDSILQKISEEGEHSLTERERKVLDEASKHYRSQNES